MDKVKVIRGEHKGKSGQLISFTKSSSGEMGVLQLDSDSNTTIQVDVLSLAILDEEARLSFDLYDPLLIVTTISWKETSFINL
jgi:hypothetical protein